VNDWKPGNTWFTWFIERNVTILPDTAEEQLDAACLFDLFLVHIALFDQIKCIPIQNVDLGWGDIDVREEFSEHESMVALGVITRQTNVLIHVEGHYMFKTARTLADGNRERSEPYLNLPALKRPIKCL
jgi:hypothetical protein